MIDDESIAEDLIRGKSKHSPSYHLDYAKKTYGEIKRLAKQNDPRAKQMKKLIQEDRKFSQRQLPKPRKPRR